jgi:hypothetical protein
LIRTDESQETGEHRAAWPPYGKSKGKRQKSLSRAGLGRDHRGLAAIKTIVNDSIVNDTILERRTKKWDFSGTG